MGRAGIVFGLAAAVAFIASFLLRIPFINIILALGSVVALGWGAGRTAAKVTGAAAGQGTGRGAGAGAIAGLIQLIGLTIALLLLANVPVVRQQLDLALQQAAQQNPNVAGSGLTGGALSNIFGVVGGLLCGGINFILMLIGGLIGGATWRGTPNQGEYVAAGRSGGGLGSGGTGTASTYNTSSTTGTGYGTPTGTASTYDTNTTTSTDYGTTGAAATYDTSTTTDTSYGQSGTTGTTGDQGEGEGGVRVYDSDDRNRT